MKKRENFFPRPQTFLASLLVLATWLAAAEPSALAQTAPSWQQRWEKFLNGAKKEGKVVVWGPPGDLIRQAMTEGLKKAFPEITIEYTGSRGDEKATKMRAERDASIYSVDVVLDGTTTANLYLKPMGALDPIMPALVLPEVRDLKYWRNQRWEFSDNEQKYNLVFVSLILNPVFYNLKQVRPEEVDELYELLDPKWKGKVVINDPIPTGQGNIIFRWIWEVQGAEKAQDFYRQIRAQAAAVDRDQRRQIEWVAQGKYPLLLGGSNSVGQQLLQTGLKFGVIGEFKDYGAALSASFGSTMLINKAPHPNAASVFLNWLLGKEGQTAWSRAMNHVSLRADVPTDYLPPYVVPRRGGQYWVSHLEKDMKMPPEQVRILKELFGR